MSHAKNPKYPDRPKRGDAAAQILLAHIAASRTHLDVPAEDRAGETEHKFQLDCRRSLLNELERYARVLASPTKVFIAFSKDFEDRYEVLAGFFRSKGYEPINGMTDSAASRILTEVVDKISNCSCFLGVWTGNYHVSSVNSVDGRTHLTAPTVWMPFEFGIAIAKGVITKIMVEQDIHPDFVAKPDGDNRRIFFNRSDQNLLQQAELVYQYFEEQVGERGPRWAATSPLDLEYPLRPGRSLG